jgi:hypothetical protein
MQAQGVPIEVSMCCHQKVSSIWKILEVRTRRKVSIINSEGKFGGGVAYGYDQVDDGLHPNIWLDCGVHGGGVNLGYDQRQLGYLSIFCVWLPRVIFVISLSIAPIKPCFCLACDYGSRGTYLTH